MDKFDIIGVSSSDLETIRIIAKCFPKRKVKWECLVFRNSRRFPNHIQTITFGIRWSTGDIIYNNVY